MLQPESDSAARGILTEIVGEGAGFPKCLRIGACPIYEYIELLE
jgi:hypothetical protein